jgi:hypothetical protein
MVLGVQERSPVTPFSFHGGRIPPALGRRNGVVFHFLPNFCHFRRGMKDDRDRPSEVLAGSRFGPQPKAPKIRPSTRAVSDRV